MYFFFFADFNLYSLAVIICNCDITVSLGPVSPFIKSSEPRVASGTRDTVGVLSGVCCIDPDLRKWEEKEVGNGRASFLSGIWVATELPKL